MTSIESLRAAGWVEVSPGVMERGKSRQFLPPPVADASAELGPAAVNAGQSGRESGSQRSQAAASTKRIRQSSKPLMNKLETEFHSHLQHLYPGQDFHPQCKRFRLGNGIWYKPDFSTSGSNFSTEMVWEVKGPHAFRGGLENLKVAAGLYPEIRWILVWKDAGVWQTQEVLP